MGIQALTEAPAVKHAPKKMPMLQTAVVILIAFTITIAVFYYVGLFDEFQASPDQTLSTTTTPSRPTLTPARNLEGTWKTAFAVKFYIKTDFETLANSKT